VVTARNFTFPKAHLRTYKKGKKMFFVAVGPTWIFRSVPFDLGKKIATVPSAPAGKVNAPRWPNGVGSF